MVNYLQLKRIYSTSEITKILEQRFRFVINARSLNSYLRGNKKPSPMLQKYLETLLKEHGLKTEENHKSTSFLEF